jgi:methionine transaminase
MIVSKLPQVGTTIFSQMSKLAAEHQAINLSQGFPDFGNDPLLPELVFKYMKEGFNQYAPMQGVPILRERIAEKTNDIYKLTVNPETEITVTSGATEALFAAIHAIIKKNDEVIVLEPCYDSYIPAIQLAGGIPIPISLSLPDYSLPQQKIIDAITEKTKLIIINSPHNPTGSVLQKNDLEFLAQILTDTNIFVISDEVYEHIIFDNIRHESVLHYPELRKRSFVISSFGKTFHTTGWKIGYCIAPAELTMEFRKIHQFLTFSSHTPTQLAIAEYLQYKDKYENLPSFYQEKRDYFRSLFTNSKFELLPCNGTYFQLMSFKNISPNETDIDFAIRITKDYGVASIPISVFYTQKEDNHLLRFCFAKTNETMEKAAYLLNKL